MKKILLVGLGRVGWTYDLETGKRSGDNFLTHYKSLKYIQSLSANHFELYVHDISQEVCTQFHKAQPWEKVLRTEDELFAHDWDLVVVATNTNQILKTVEKFSSLNKFTKFIVEKPVAADLDTLKKFIDTNRTNSLLERIRVGFPRRTLNSSKKIKDIFNHYSKDDLSFEIKFSGGASNILSHFLDLVEYWFGTLQLIDVDTKGRFSLLSVIKHPKIKIEVYQSGKTNNEDSTIVSKKKELFRYVKSGRLIEIYDAKTKNKVVFKGEIEQMILSESIEYVQWGLYDNATILTSLPSSSIEIALDMEAHFADT